MPPRGVEPLTLGASNLRSTKLSYSGKNDCPRIVKEFNLPLDNLIVPKCRHDDPWTIELVAGAGLERCDLWVMSPTSYQLLHPANFLIVADERFERPNTGFRILCLTSLANRQKLAHVKGIEPLFPAADRQLFQLS